MKKNTIYFMAILLIGMAACKKDSVDEISVEESFEEPHEALERYRGKINESADGWEFGLSGSESGFYVGFLDFGDGGTARFAVDANASSGAGLVNTGYRFGTSGTNAVLGFADGSPFATFATAGQGLDTAFTFTAISGDTVFLRGNTHGSDLVLTKASAARAQAYAGGGVVNTIQKVADLARFPLYFKILTLNGANYDLHFNTDYRILYIHYGGVDNYKVHETPYGRTATGIYLQKPLVDGINIIGYLDALDVNPASGTMAATVNGTGVTITNYAAPSAYGLAAPAAFADSYSGQANIADGEGNVNAERFSASLNGFTVAGVADAHGVRNIPGYQFMTLFQRFTGQEHGGVWFLLGNNQLNPLGGPAMVRIYSTDGGLVGFVQVGSFEGASEDPAVAAIVASVAASLTDQYGFFVVKSGPLSYDLVSVSTTGGQKWIRFE